MTKAKLTNLVRIITVAVSVLIFVLVCIIIAQYAKLGSLSSRSAALDRQIAENTITQENLEAGIERRKDPSYVEQQARENLGLIKEKGETIYEEEDNNN